MRITEDLKIKVVIFRYPVTERVFRLYGNCHLCLQCSEI